jgi:hypothetical protein
MSTESWLFLFAAFGGLGGIATIASFWLQAAAAMRITKTVENPQEGSAESPTFPIAFTVTRGQAVAILILLCISVAFSLVGLGSNLSRVKSGSVIGGTGPIIKAWGAPAGSNLCTVMIDGSQLVKWSIEYRVAFVCGFTDPTVDKYEDMRITVSAPFSIHPGDIEMSVHFSDAMMEKQKEIISQATRNMPKGVLVGVPLSTWNEVVLLRTGPNVADIRRLSDVPRYNGAVLSQGFPK